MKQHDKTCPQYRFSYEVGYGMNIPDCNCDKMPQMVYLTKEIAIYYSVPTENKGQVGYALTDTLKMSAPVGVRIDDLVKLVNEQAEDESLWFMARYITEGHLQNELRKLHNTIELVAQMNGINCNDTE